MTEMEFDLGLTGDKDRTVGGSRLCYLVAEGLSARAKERQRQGRPDKASSLSGIAGKLMAKVRPSKTALRKVWSDIEVVKERLVDGTAITQPD